MAGQAFFGLGFEALARMPNELKKLQREHYKYRRKSRTLIPKCAGYPNPGSEAPEPWFWNVEPQPPKTQPKIKITNPSQINKKMTHQQNIFFVIFFLKLGGLSSKSWGSKFCTHFWIGVRGFRNTRKPLKTLFFVICFKRPQVKIKFY